MFDDSINLLPEQQRRREIEERRDKSKPASLPPKQFHEPSQPSTVKSPIPKPTVVKQSWWQRLNKWLGGKTTAKPPRVISAPLKAAKEVVSSKPSTVVVLSDTSKNKESQPVKAEHTEHKDIPVVDIELNKPVSKTDKVKAAGEAGVSVGDFLPAVNLIPLGIQGGSVGQAKKIIWSSGLIALLLVGFGSGGLLVYKNKLNAASAAANDKLVSLQGVLEKVRQEAEEATFFQTKIKALTAALTHRVSWLPFFSWLEKNTVGDVYFNGLAADSSGRVTLSGYAPDYTEIAKQFRAFEQSKQVQQVEVTNLRLQKNDQQISNVSFSFTVVAPDLFKPVTGQ